MASTLVSLETESNEESGSIIDVYEDYSYSPDGELMKSCSREETLEMLELLAEKQRARVEGVALIKRHLKKSQEHPQGIIAEREGSVHISNLMALARWEQTKAGQKAPAAQS